MLDLKSSPIMTMAAQIALTHHEKWDGTGYPLGLCRREYSVGGPHHRGGGRVRRTQQQAPL